MAPRFVLGCALLCGGCGADSDAPASSAPPGCAPDEWLRDDGVCVPAGLPPDMPCPPGEWLREADCIPAGVPPDGCGEGFVHDMDRGCEPILPSEPCADGFMAVPGETRCHEVAPCAPGTWGDIPLEPDTVYVDASYTGGGSDGSQSAPWPTIQEALVAAPPGAMVAVGPGEYVDVEVRKPVRLWGKCPSLVQLAGSGIEQAAIFIYPGATGTEVRRFGVHGQARGVLVVGSEEVAVEELWIHDNLRYGLTADDTFGPTSVVVRRTLLERNGAVGALVAGAAATIDASVVRDTTDDAQGGRAIGVVYNPATSSRAELTVLRSLLERNHGLGVYVDGAGATLDSTVVRDTSLSATGIVVAGIQAQDNTQIGVRANVTVVRSLVERNYQIGVLVQGSDATLEATVVRDTLQNAQSEFGLGIAARNTPSTGARANVTVVRSLVERNQELGVFFQGSDGVVEATVVRDTSPNAQGDGGYALHVQYDPDTDTAASASLRRSLFERSVATAVFVTGPATAELDACLVRNTTANMHGLLGDGLVTLSARGPASTTVTATRIEASERAAVSSFGATVALGSSVLVCQSFDIGAEPWEGVPAVFDNRGGVLCGCPEATERCKAQSYALAPPPPPQ